MFCLGVRPKPGTVEKLGHKGQSIISLSAFEELTASWRFRCVCLSVPVQTTWELLIKRTDFQGQPFECRAFSSKVTDGGLLLGCAHQKLSECLLHSHLARSRQSSLQSLLLEVLALDPCDPE